jgi:hypothetical protein
LSDSDLRSRQRALPHEVAAALNALVVHLLVAGARLVAAAKQEKPLAV